MVERRIFGKKTAQGLFDDRGHLFQVRRTHPDMRVDSVVMRVRAVFSVRLGEFDLFGAFGGDRKTLRQIDHAKARVQTREPPDDRLLDREPDTKEYAAAGDFPHLRRGRHKRFRLFAGRNQNDDAAGIPRHGVNQARKGRNGYQDLGSARIRLRRRPAPPEREKKEQRRQKETERPPPPPFRRLDGDHWNSSSPNGAGSPTGTFLGG